MSGKESATTPVAPGTRNRSERAATVDSRGISSEVDEEPRPDTGTTPFGTPGQTPNSALWRDTYRNSKLRQRFGVDSSFSPGNTPRRLFDTPTPFPGYPDLSGLTAGMATPDPVAEFLLKTKQRPTTVVSDDEVSAELADNEWDIGTIDHLKAWVQMDPSRVLKMLNILRVERDQGVLYTEESTHQDIPNSVVASEIRKLKIANASLNENNGNLINQVDSAMGRVAELESEVNTLRRQDRGASLGTNSEERKGKLTPKMRDLPVFTGTDEVEYEDWEIQVRDRFEVNYDHFLSESAKIVFMCNSIGGEALGHVRPRREKGTSDPYTTPQDVFDHLASIYGEVDRAGKARREYRNTYQGSSGRFAAFKSNMLRLAGILKYHNDQVRDDICDQMAPRLKDALIVNPQIRHSASMKETFDWLQKLDNDQLADAERKKNALARRPQRKETAATTTKTSKDVTKETKYHPNSYKRDAATTDRLAMERLLGLCHNCHQAGHISAMCSDKKSTNVNSMEDVDMSKN